MNVTRRTCTGWAAAMLMAMAGLMSCTPRSSTPPSTEAAQGGAAPIFDLELLDGGRLNLADHQGQSIVILDFWATWCPPCRAAMPVLSEVASEFEDKGVKLYAVNLREDPETIRAFLKETGLELAVALDSEAKVAALYGVEGIPRTVVIDTEGRIADVHVGYSPGLKKELTSVLTELVGP